MCISSMPSKDHASRPEGLEPQHPSHLSLGRAMVLFNDLVEVSDLPDFHLCAPCSSL
jgi:hypothetical protein